jgi:hypothetical protein
VLGPQTSYLALGLCLVLLGTGTGLIFPTLTLSYQSAVHFHELGVATSLNQFCRSFGSTLGSAVFGSILILRFAPEVRSALPEGFGAWFDGPGGAAVRDPQALLNPSAAEALRAGLAQAFPDAPGAADLVLGAIRIGLAGALHWVFAAGALVMLGGLIGSLLWTELPIGRERPAAAAVD